MHMRHDIVPSFLFFLGSDIELLSVQMLHSQTRRRQKPGVHGRDEGDGTNEVFFHLFDGFIGDRKSKLLLRDGEIEPEFPPSVVPVL